MSAILGNANALANIPYDLLFKNPNDFSDRMARNQLLLLKEEAYLDQVANPADGAYYIETLTRQLAEQALALFKQIEQGGGLLKQLGEHKIQQKIRANAAVEQSAYDNGELVLVGSNAYVAAQERMKNEIDKKRPASKSLKTSIEPLPLRRLAAGKEKKRLKDE